jgi:hypothetical protein
MVNSKSNSIRYSQIILLLLCAISLFALSCKSKETRAFNAVKERLKNQNLRDIQLVIFHPSKDTPGKAYMGVDVTHNFATGEGKFQHEYLGFILKQEGQEWTVEKSAGYTKDPAQAEVYIAGGK